MDLLAFERKLDSTIMRKRLDIQEALKRPVKVKRKLRVFISNQYFPAKPDSDPKDDAAKVVCLFHAFFQISHVNHSSFMAIFFKENIKYPVWTCRDPNLVPKTPKKTVYSEV